MRAVLITNPKATSTSRRALELLVRAFSDDLNVEIAETGHRGHATELARRAADGGCDLVIALGGDGTVNETVNGLLADGPSDELPAMAVVPGGSANVFARALGMPNDPISATSMILDAVRAGRHRTVGLGLADDRYFTFCAGAGLDAEVIRLVERLRSAGLRAHPTLYIRAALRQFFSVTDRRRPALTVERPGRSAIDGLFLAIVSNTSPWTYAGPYRVNPSPWADFNLGLDLFATHSLELGPVLGASARMLLPRAWPGRGRSLVDLHDEAELTLRSARPIAFQLDGDYLGERECVTIRSVTKAIRIVI